MIPISIILGLIFSAIIIPLTLYRRSSDPREQSGFFAGMQTSGIIFITSLIVFPLTSQLLENTYRYITDPTYEATVVDMETREDDENGLMYSKVFQFTDNQGEVLRKVSSLSSGGKPVIGVQEKIKYADGVLLELSLAGILVTLGGLLGLHLLGLFPLYYLFYATGFNDYADAVADYGIQFVLKVLFPLGMAVIAFASLNKLWLGLSGAEDIPVGSMIMISIFGFSCLIGLKAVLDMFWGKDSKSNPFSQINKNK